MIIKYKTDPKGKYRRKTVEPGITVAQFVDLVKDNLKYDVYAARINQVVDSLDTILSTDSELELLDMRTQVSKLIYQNSLNLIYIKAVDDVCPDCEVEIETALSKGIYTEIKKNGKIVNLSEKKIAAIEERMYQLVEADLPFNREVVSRETAIEFLKANNREERMYLLESVPNMEKVKFYSLDGYKDSFYGSMVPSTKYIKRFKLTKYRKGVLLRFPQPEDPNSIPEHVDEVKLFGAYMEQSEWDELLGVRYVSELNHKVEKGEYEDLIQLSEALHEKKVAQIADMIKRGHKRLILIAGPSSSGKTTFARRLCVQLRVVGLNPLYMGTDDYFVEREETPLDEHGEPNYEGIEAVDVKLFNNNMNDLLAGKEVDLPSFNFLTGHKEYGKRITKIEPNQPIVIEGIHGLNDDLTKFIPKEEKFKIYISPLTQLNIDMHNRIPATDERMLRRMVRDYQFRGHSAKDTISQWPKVRAGEDVNIFPYSDEADVLFNSYHVYEIAVLKKYAEPLLEEIKQGEPEYADARRMLRFLRFFQSIEDDSMIVNNSIIREFIGGSIFVK
ncbi:MAG: nucleoside kinase [Firmicutes bacterium]|nr:nucleoside kinase [Bacillota bacterium]